MRHGEAPLYFQKLTRPRWEFEEAVLDGDGRVPCATSSPSSSPMASVQGGGGLSVLDAAEEDTEKAARPSSPAFVPARQMQTLMKAHPDLITINAIRLYYSLIFSSECIDYSPGGCPACILRWQPLSGHPHSIDA